MNMSQNISLSKYLLVCTIGFGLGGALWGWILYNDIPEVEFPFHFMAIVIMGLFGGISLVWFNKSVKQISKSILAGFLGYGVGFFTAPILIYSLYFYCNLALVAVPLEAETLNGFLNLDPGIEIGYFWFAFFFIGAIIGLSYALFLKLKKWSLIWRGGIGFALGSLIGPIIGNLLGNAFNSLLISYLITFSLMGIILGLFLSWGLWRD